MKKFLLLGLLFGWMGTSILYGQEGNFFLHENGVTVMCPDAEVGDTGEVNGVMFTKRTRDQITEENASTTCTSGITDMSDQFYSKFSFNEDISHWDVSSVTNMHAMFDNAQAFNGDLSSWDVSSVVNMEGMFMGAHSFNGDINSWDVSSVTTMRAMFIGAHSFNGDISSWDVSNVTTMRSMFWGASAFNQDISNWTVSSVTNMALMFRTASSFNSEIGAWDVSNVTSMRSMFWEASAFNQHIGDWDVSSVTIMGYMFVGASSFRGDLRYWDVSNVNHMTQMFKNASSFNQDISGWCVELLEEEPEDFSTGSPLIEEYKPVWGTCEVTSVIETEYPLSFSLSQNYPNPFNPSTVISYQLPVSNEVSLEVFDMLGRRVAVLENGLRSAGRHEVRFDASSLSSGIYIYRITAGEFVETRKMMLVK